MEVWNPKKTDFSADREFLQQLYCRYEGLMFDTARSYTEDLNDQQDIVQTAMVRLIQHENQLMALDECVVASYVVTTVKHTAMNFCKKRQRLLQRFFSFENMDVLLPEPQTSMDELLILSERKRSILDVLDRLSEDDRMLLSGKYLLGESDDALAAILQCSPGSIRMKLTRARRRVLKLWKEDAALYDQKTKTNTG